MIIEKEITIIEKDYLNDLKKIKETIKTNQNKAMMLQLLTIMRLERLLMKEKIGKINM